MLLLRIRLLVLSAAVTTVVVAAVTMVIITDVTMSTVVSTLAAVVGEAVVVLVATIVGAVARGTGGVFFFGDFGGCFERDGRRCGLCTRGSNGRSL